MSEAQDHGNGNGTATAERSLDDIRKELAQAKAARATQCEKEVRAVLQRFGCKIVTLPDVRCAPEQDGTFSLRVVAVAQIVAEQE